MRRNAHKKAIFSSPSRQQPKMTLVSTVEMYRAEKTCGNPAMTFPIKKRIYTELFIDRTTALYRRDITNDQRIAICFNCTNTYN